jgi:hypothetical protein
MELKSEARWQERDLEGQRAFSAATPQCEAALLCPNGEGHL